MHFAALTHLAAEFHSPSHAPLQVTWGDLVPELQACERRLGTPQERPGDFERARHLAHEINNRRTVACLAEHLRQSAAEFNGTQKVA